MSVDQNSDSFELPTISLSERAREEGIFKAVAAYEKKHGRTATPIRSARSGLGAFLMRPAVQFATVGGLALIIATPWLSSINSLPKPDSHPVPTSSVTPQSSPQASVAEAQERGPIAAAPPSERDLSRRAASDAPTAPLSNVPRGEPQQTVSPPPAPPVASIAPPMPMPTKPAARPVPKVAAQDVGQYFRFTGGGSFGDSPAAAPVTRSSRSGEAVPRENRDQFANAAVNAFKDVAQDPVSTFSIDVDTASYSIMRSKLMQNQLPPAQSVRTEELINYFPYDYARPVSAAEPFASDVSVMPNPWVKGRKLIRIGIKGYDINAEERPPANLVFLIDTSGSMNAPNRLPLVRQSLEMLVSTLKPNDRVAIVAYAGSAGTVLAPTPASQKSQILAALDRLSAGGSTAGGAGLQLAYNLAEANFDPKAVNRVMLATDGDFNVGITNKDELKSFIEGKREKGIFLSVLGFGMGNLNDSLMQALAQNGNGVAAYIDTLAEARKVLVEEASSSLFPIAKDVKIQVEFNPAIVAEYRLVGYETRLLNRDDFNNDKVDAGDVGSGASVTAIYDIVPKGGPRLMDDSRYQPAAPAETRAPTPAKADEYAFLKIRYKLPKSDTSTLITRPITRTDEVSEISKAPESARFAVAVASFGEYLRNASQMGNVKLDEVIDLANAAKGSDPYGYRAEFVSLVRAAKTIKALRGD